jgi:hypothetical protein
MGVSMFQFVCVVSALALAVSAQEHAKIEGTLSMKAVITYQGQTGTVFDSANGAAVVCTTAADNTYTEPNFDVDPFIVGKIPITKFEAEFERDQGDQTCVGEWDPETNLGFYLKGTQAQGAANSFCDTNNNIWGLTLYIGPGVKDCSGTNGATQAFGGSNGNCVNHEFTFTLPIPDHPDITATFTIKLAILGECRVSGANSNSFQAAETAMSKAMPSKLKKSSSSSSTCFPASASAKMADGTTKLFSALQVGDSILTGKSQFSEVHMFSHHYPEAVNPFVQLTTAAGHELRLTAGHFLYVNGSLVKAGSVRVGDALEDAAGAPVVVVKTATVKDTGLYNPHTMDGDVVVNGIRTSTYTDAIHPTMAHALLAPIRALYSMGKALEL